MCLSAALEVRALEVPQGCLKAAVESPESRLRGALEVP